MLAFESISFTDAVQTIGELRCESRVRLRPQRVSQRRDMVKIRRSKLCVDPSLRAEYLPFNVDTGIVFKNVVRQEPLYRPRPVLLQHGGAEAVERRLKVKTLIQRNHLRSFSAVASVSGFQFLTWRR
jgi:hypothetical protein